MHPFEEFLNSFIPKLAEKTKQLYKVLWILETTGSEDAADLKTSLDIEYRLLFHDKEIYQKLLEWQKNPPEDPLLARQLKILILSYQRNMLPEKLLQKISEKESEIALEYARFRPKLAGKSLSENDIREILKKETDPAKRKKAWELSKEIGQKLSGKIRELAKLRNEGARHLGFQDFFAMELELQEVDGKWLLSIFDRLAETSNSAYEKTLDAIEDAQAKRFHVSKEALGPWAWSDPFCQEDPLDSHTLDQLVKDVDIVASSKEFFRDMGFDVHPILERSDLYEKEGKNQHAFCINMDRNEDVRTLNNIKPTIKWLETVLHELGHAVYELGFEKKLPWLLREPPHMIPTEAMALICGRQAYLGHFLKRVVKENAELFQKAEESLKRRQRIFSRWVLVMTHFEAELYRNPDQDLNKVWWDLVEKFQRIKRPEGREGKEDWAAKYHVGLAPVYYFSYLLGEMFASAIQENLQEKFSQKELSQKEVGAFLKEKLFHPGAKFSWDKLIEHTLEKPFDEKPWLAEYA